MELRCSWCRWSRCDPATSTLTCLKGRPFVSHGNAHWCHDYEREAGADDSCEETTAAARAAAEFPVPLWLAWNLCADPKRHALWVLAGLNPGFHLYANPWGYLSLDERRAIRRAIENVLETDGVAATEQKACS